jgi:hypothetical protein
MHPGTACGAEQTLLQPLQWFGSVFKFASHPSELTELQLAKPVLQLETTQVPLLHEDAASNNEQT